MTNLPESTPSLAVCRDYNQRAGCEEVIRQLAADFALPQLCVQKFWGTEAALSLAVFSYNLCTLFQRRLGWLDRVTASTLRFRLFTTGGIIRRSGDVTTLRLSLPEAERGWWSTISTKLISQDTNCPVIRESSNSLKAV